MEESKDKICETCGADYYGNLDSVHCPRCSAELIQKSHEEESQEQVDENSMAGWMHSIRELGEESRRRDERVSQKFLDAPHDEVMEQDCKIGIWRGVGCIVTIPFYSNLETLNIHAIEYHTLAFVDALKKVRDQEEPKKEELIYDDES
jgi:hypothetical protein